MKEPEFVRKAYGMDNKVTEDFGRRCLLATRLGTACADMIDKGQYGVMVAARGDSVKAVPLEDVAGKLKYVPPDHAWVATARRVNTCMGD